MRLKVFTLRLDPDAGGFDDGALTEFLAIASPLGCEIGGGGGEGPLELCAGVSCPPGQACDPATGECWGSGGGSDLCAGVTCGSGESCNAATGVCEGPADGCADVTCGACESCEPSSGLCSSDCAATEVCREGACVTDPCAEVTCGEGEVCDEGECASALCADVSCGACERCEPGSGACVSDCVEGESCYQDACCAPSCAGAECGDDGCGGNCGQCGEGEICTGAGSCEEVQVGSYVLIPSGRFTMGSPEGELFRREDETQHEVVLTRSFYLKATEVTQGEWRSLMGNNPSHFSSCGDECPVESVNWWEVVAYCNALSRAEGLPECYTLSGRSGTPGVYRYSCGGVSFAGLDCVGYRLPTESEWEYANRAGTTTAFHNGDITEEHCDEPNLAAIGWYCGNAERSEPVGQKDANAWGLYDMAGNVLEWSWDWSGSYPAGTVTDPVGPATGTYRVARGGAWITYARSCRAAFRYEFALDYTHHSGILGFRPARSVP